MPSIKFVKDVLKRVVREKEDNLIRLRFDYYYTDKALKKKWEEQKEYEQKKAKVEELKKAIIDEKHGKSKKNRDKEKIIRLENEMEELKDYVKEYENSIQKLTNQKKRIEELINQSVNIVNEIKKVLSNKKFLNFLRGKDEKEN